RPEEPEARGQPGEQPVGVPETLAPGKDALAGARRRGGGAPFRLQEVLRPCQLDKLVEVVYGQRFAEPLSVGRTDGLRSACAVEVCQEEVFFLTEVEELASARVLDHVLALAAEWSEE